MTPRKSNIFEKALADAEKRLAKALNERAQAQDVLADLAKEIPSLQQTISALQHQLNPELVEKAAEWKGIVLPQIPTVDQIVARVAHGPIDPIVAQALAMTENDTLPEPEGEPVLPEE